jgi:DNA-binding transcriptional ArsR family regulator
VSTGRHGTPAPEFESQKLDQALIRSLAHPLRIRILEVMQTRAASPVELSRQFRLSVGVVSYHVNVLRQTKAIAWVRNGKARGAVEHFYRANPWSSIADQQWRRVPIAIRSGITSEAIRTFVAKAGEALDAGTIDSRDETTLNWMPVSVDERGWAEIAEIFDRARSEIMAVAAQSRDRLGSRNGIPMVTAMAAFETPPSSP